MNGWSSCLNHYKLLDLIGSGSFGRVFRSYCQTNGKECAIKCIAKQCHNMDDKILNEVYIHKRLCHENILELFTVLEDSKAVYFIMEICNNGSLGQLIVNEKQKRKQQFPILSYELISSLMIQICDALKYLHRNYIVHRDININNILIKRIYHNENNVLKMISIKLCDFGLAIDLKSSKCESTTICGTPGFISPEIWNQNNIHNQNTHSLYKCDIFSLGSIIYACIMGNTPKGHIILDSSISPMASNLIGQLLEHDPAKRLEIDEIRQHIFINGRINDTNRLFSIVKTTNALKMSIDHDHGIVRMHFNNDNLSIHVKQDGTIVNIIDDESNEYEYNFYELPEKYWKHYLYVVRFVNLVRSKTRKIIVHCTDDWFNQNNSNNRIINKLMLMNDGHFEVNIYDTIRNVNQSISLDDLNNDDESIKNKLNQLIIIIKQLEQLMEIYSKKLSIDMFPITIGVDSTKLLNSF